MGKNEKKGGESETGYVKAGKEIGAYEKSKKHRRRIINDKK